MQMDRLIKSLVVSVIFAACCNAAPLQNSSETEGELIKTDLINDCDCDWRYLKHYDAKSCQVTEVDDCGCPKRFLCPNNTSPDTDLSTCTYQNKVYSFGSKIITSNPCHVCRCQDENGPKIQCLSKECPQIDVPLKHNCHLLYEKNKCCPVGFKCVTDEEKENKTGLCEYNGNFYPLAAKIYPADDPCLDCDCTEDWNGISNSSCRQHDCMFEKNTHLLNAGCIPVYHESRCCPIEFYCPHNDLSASSFINDSEDGIIIDFDSQCLFAGQLYKRGAELPIGNDCVKCACMTPPDFTCVHMTCPLPPSADNCYAQRIPGECCPTYECVYADENTQEFNGTVCPTPICADSSCRIEVPIDSECPTCICNSSESSLEKNELQPMSENFEDLEDKLAENSEAMDDIESDSEKLESLENNLSQFETPSMKEKFVEENLEEVNDATDVKQQGDKIEEVENEILSEVNLQQSSENQSDAEGNEFESTNENHNIDNEFQRVVHKRSQVMNQLQQQEPIYNQQQTQFSDIEREDGISFRQNNDDYDGEIRSFQGKKSENTEKSSNGLSDKRNINNLDSEIEVPDGCPTPMCENAICKIQIPAGHHCPTCICKGDGNRQP